MDGFLVFLGYYFLAGALIRVIIYLLAELGIIGPKYCTVGIVEHIIEFVLTAILWPLMIVTFVIEFPGYLHSISPEGKAQAAQRAREEIEAKLAPWVPEEWLEEVCPEKILQEEVYEATWPARQAFRNKIEPGDEVRVDEADSEIRAGKEHLTAVNDAAISRARPVLLGALTTILGLAPLLADPFFKSMAVTIIFALAFATVLTLVVVPLLYAALFRIPNYV